LRPSENARTDYRTLSLEKNNISIFNTLELMSEPRRTETLKPN
jgi:hypothetical protein